MDLDCVVRSGLKLKKNPADVDGEKKKKKKSKSKAGGSTDISGVEKNVSTSSAPQRKSFKTKAELAFQETKDKMLQKTIREKAMKTHKQKVEGFNRHLDSLTEHFDIQKVSWTK